MKLVFKIIGVAILWYLCFAYVLLEANPLLWDKNQRFDFTFLVIGISLGVTANHYIKHYETR